MTKDNIKEHIVGHRGAGNAAPSSTMAALEKAAELGLEWVEFDARLTADGHLVIANTDNLAECSGQNIKISESKLQDLLEVDVGRSFKGTNEVHQILLFEDAIQYCIDNNIRTQIELKGEGNQEHQLAQAVYDHLNQENVVFPAGKDPLITSFSPTCLNAIHELSGNTFETGLLVHTHLASDWEQVANEVQPTYVHFYGGIINDGDRLTDRFAQSVHDAGFLLNAYKVNTREDALAAIDAGTKRFTSDEPEALLV